MDGGLAREDAPALDVADSSYPAPLDMAEGSSALDVAAAEGPAPKGGAESDPAPEGVGAGSPSAAFMDVHVGSPPVQSEEAAVTHLSAALASLVTLEASDPDARSLPLLMRLRFLRVMPSILFLLTSPQQAMYQFFLL